MRTPIRARRTRDGIAMILVLGVGLVVLAIGMAMISTSGGLLQTTIDAKQRIRSRYAAEGMIAIQIARSVEKASEYFGQGLTSEEIDWMDLQSAGGEKAKAEIINQTRPGDALAQEKIQTGRMKGLMGLKIPIRVVSTSRAGASAKQEIDADVRLYQVPIFQFGVFYEGNLEITPGPNMDVFGPVHTNSNAYFRGYSGSVLSFRGPVTASGTIYHWRQSGGTLRYFYTPDTSKYLDPSLGTSMTALSSTTKPPMIGGLLNIDDQREKLILPIGGSVPQNLIVLRDSSDADALKKQKFDRMVSPTGSNRWVNGESPSRSWITGPKVFFDRREKRWVKFWDFDIAAYAATGLKDSIFYLADTITMLKDHGQTPDYLLNAFRIVNASRLPRNMTIASANPVYILGNFNLAQTVNPVCAPRDYVGTIPDSLKYCNAQIAADAVTLLSPNWTTRTFALQGMNGSLEHPDTNAVHWTTYVSRNWNGALWRWDSIYADDPSSGVAGSLASGSTVRVNAAILTGNKPARSSSLAPSNTNDTYFDNNYEGGWHNTIRFLENLSGSTVVFKGSFVCLWAASTKGLNQDSTGTPTIRGGYYNPPTRLWGFDPRFRSLNNMPPGTPFLATAIFTNWVERQ